MHLSKHLLSDCQKGELSGSLKKKLAQILFGPYICVMKNRNQIIPLILK